MDPFARATKAATSEARAAERQARLAARVAAAIPLGADGVVVPIPPITAPAPPPRVGAPTQAEREAKATAESTAVLDAPFEISPIEAARLKLRERRRRLAPGAAGDAPTELITLPGVHGFDLAIRYVDGGRDTVVAFIQLAVLEGSPAAVAWWQAFADLTPYERKICSFDDVCAASGVKPSALMAAVVSAAMDAGRDAGNLIAASTLPEVVSQMAKSGKLIDGQFAELSLKDRHAFLQGQGFLPTSKGSTIHVHASANAQAAAAVAGDKSVPGFSTTMSSLGDVRRQAIDGTVIESPRRLSVPAFLASDDDDPDEAQVITVPAAGGQPADDEG